MNNYPPNFNERDLDEKNLEEDAAMWDDEEGVVLSEEFKKTFLEDDSEEYERISLEGNTDMGLHEIEDLNQIPF